MIFFFRCSFLNRSREIKVISNYGWINETSHVRNSKEDSCYPPSSGINVLPEFTLSAFLWLCYWILGRYLP